MPSAFCNSGINFIWKIASPHNYQSGEESGGQKSRFGETFSAAVGLGTVVGAYYGIKQYRETCQWVESYGSIRYAPNACKQETAAMFSDLKELSAHDEQKFPTDTKDQQPWDRSGDGDWHHWQIREILSSLPRFSQLFSNDTWKPRREHSGPKFVS